MAGIHTGFQTERDNLCVDRKCQKLTDLTERIFECILREWKRDNWLHVLVDEESRGICTDCSQTRVSSRVGRGVLLISTGSPNYRMRRWSGATTRVQTGWAYKYSSSEISRRMLGYRGSQRKRPCEPVTERSWWRELTGRRRGPRKGPFQGP